MKTLLPTCAGLLACASITMTALTFCIATDSSAQPAPRGGEHGPQNGPPRGGQNGDSKNGEPRGPQDSAAHDIRLLEGALGITLTDDQKTEIKTATTTRETAMKAAQTRFKNGVAALFGLTEAELRSKLQSLGGGRNFRKDLKKVLGRELTDEEKASLKALAQTRDEECKSAIDTYRESVAKTVGIDLDELDDKIQAFLESKEGGQGGPGKGPGKGDCQDKDKTDSGGGTTNGGGSGNYS